MIFSVNSAAKIVFFSRKAEAKGQKEAGWAGKK
jgi:hypothetical protein